MNPEDDETNDPVAAGMVVKWDPTEPSNWRAAETLVEWLEKRGRIGIGGIDTRRLTRAIRQQGAPHVALAYNPMASSTSRRWCARRVNGPGSKDSTSRRT